MIMSMMITIMKMYTAMVMAKPIQNDNKKK